MGAVASVIHGTKRQGVEKFFHALFDGILILLSVVFATGNAAWLKTGHSFYKKGPHVQIEGHRAIIIPLELTACCSF